MLTRKILAVCLGLCLGLSVAEIAVRWLAPARPLRSAYDHYAADAYLPYKGKPSARLTGRNDTDEFDYDYRHNSLGFRDVERPLAKGAGTFRILGLGDSFTYGEGVAFEEMYLSRLETMLNGRAGAHPRVEVIKAGIPRYFPEPERMLLEKYGVPFQPDLVVVGFVANDVIDTYMGLEAVTVDRSGYLKTREAAQLGWLGVQLYTHSHLGRKALGRYVSWQIKRKYRPRHSELFQDGGFHEKDWTRVEAEYDKMAAIAASNGARLVIVHIPARGRWWWTEQRAYPASRLSAWAARRNVGFVDVLPAMERELPRQRLYYEKDGHCTPAGQAVIAAELYRYLAERRLVP